MQTAPTPGCGRALKILLTVQFVTSKSKDSLWCAIWQSKVVLSRRHVTSFIHQVIFDEANENQVWEGPSRAKTNVKQCFHAGRMSGLHLQSWCADLIPTSAIPMKTQRVSTFQAIAALSNVETRVAHVDDTRVRIQFQYCVVLPFFGMLYICFAENYCSLEKVLKLLTLSGWNWNWASICENGRAATE